MNLTASSTIDVEWDDSFFDDVLWVAMWSYLDLRGLLGQHAVCFFDLSIYLTTEINNYRCFSHTFLNDDNISFTG
jgi:hypothetical protein